MFSKIGKHTLVIDSDEGNIEEARRLMPGLTACLHHEALSALSRKVYQKVLISGDEVQVDEVIALAFRTSVYGSFWTGVLSSGRLYEDIEEEFFVLNKTTLFFSNDSMFLTKGGGKDWEGFLRHFLKNPPAMLTIPVVPTSPW